MSCRLDKFTVDSVRKNEELNRDSFNFINLIGPKTYWSRGYYGERVIIAVVDTGVSPHKEFGDRLMIGKNFIKGYGNTSWHDDNMHGTHCAGSAAGGIASKSEILPLKVLDASGSGEWVDIIKAIDYARTWSNNGKKVKIISMSLGCSSSQISDVDKVNLEKSINSCIDEGILVVVSAGNTAKDELRYPASFENVVTVGAVDWNKKIAKFSTFGNCVDVCQIGTDVLSANYEGGYINLSGTSMSTPIVSGIAALLASDYKQRFNAEIPERKLYEALKMNTKDLGIKGIDKYYGTGFCTLQPLNMTIETEVDSKIVKFNGIPVELDIPTQIINGRTMFAIREFAEQTGAKVSWEAENEYHKTRSKFEW